MMTRFAMLSLVTALIGIFATVLTLRPASAQTTSPGLLLSNVTGTLVRGGQFTGDVTLTRLTNRAGTLVADGTVSGTTSSSGSQAAPLAPSATPSTQATPTTEPPSTPTATSTAVPTPAATPTSTLAPASETSSFSAAALAAPDAQVSTVTQSFREIPLTLADPDGGACNALSVDLSTIFLDQVGVQLDLASTTLDLATVPRANRRLVICSVPWPALVEASPSSGQAALLNELLPVVNRALSSGQR